MMPNKNRKKNEGKGGKTKKYIDISKILSPTPEFYPRTPQYVDYSSVESISRDQILFNVFLALTSGFFGAMLIGFQGWMVLNTIIFFSLTLFFGQRIQKTHKDMLNPDKMIKLNGSKSSSNTQP